jgi:hypothetical protein
MRAAMPTSRRATHDRRAIAALVAVFALLVQALIPAMAMAAPSDAAGALVICTATGTQTLTPYGKAGAPHPGDLRKSFGGMPCQDCLAAAMAAVVASSVAAEPVAYETARVDHAPVERLFTPHARTPPRPPGQGPPAA